LFLLRSGVANNDVEIAVGPGTTDALVDDLEAFGRQPARDAILSRVIVIAAAAPDALAVNDRHPSAVASAKTLEISAGSICSTVR
jgi:hypothetical protein